MTDPKESDHAPFGNRYRMSILCGLNDVTNWRTAVVPVRITPGRVVPLGGTLNGETALPGQTLSKTVLELLVRPFSRGRGVAQPVILPKCNRLVGYFPMSDPLFEPFREWTEIVRRRKGSKKPPYAVKLGGARMLRAGDGRPEAVRAKISNVPEPYEFILEHRSARAPWLNIEQLHEPSAKPSSSSLQARYKP